MTFYSDMATTARNLISEFGQPIILRSESGTFDGVLGEYTSSTVTNTTVNGVKVGDIENYKTLAGGTIEGLFEQWILDDTREPDTGDKLVIGGVTRGIVDYETVSPAGTDLIYKVTVKR